MKFGTVKTAFLLSFLLSSIGCSLPISECSSGAVKCEDSIAYSCQGDWERTWHINDDCSSSFCNIAREGGGSERAFCTLSDEQDPICEPFSSAGTFRTQKCDSNTLVLCRGGYRITETDCGTKFCIPGQYYDGQQGLAGLCALSTEEDSLCVERCADDRCEFCDGNTRVSCIRNYRAEEEDCGSDTTCVETIPNHSAHCSES